MVTTKEEEEEHVMHPKEAEEDNIEKFEFSPYDATFF